MAVEDVRARPTNEDYLAKRNFCVVHVEASSTRLCVRASPGWVRITEDSARNLRINPYGIIENIELLKYQPQSTSTYGQSGVLIGYAEDVDVLIEAGREHLEKMRATYLKRLDEHRKQFEAVVVAIERG